MKKYSYLNFHPIFKNIVSKCLAEHLHLRKNIFKNLKNYLRRQNGPKMGKNGLKKWKICNFANFKPFFDGLFLYNAMPKYSIWSCQHFGTKKLKIKWKIKSQWSFENIFLIFFTPLGTTENDWGIWVFLGAEWYNGIFFAKSQEEVCRNVLNFIWSKLDHY